MTKGVPALELKSGSFEGDRLKESGTVIVLFKATWCPFCRSFDPVFDSVPASNAYSKAFVDLSDLNNPLWETFQIQVVPTLIVFRNGDPVLRRDGILGRGLSQKDMDEVVSSTSKLR